jgi:hypothetical protein
MCQAARTVRATSQQHERTAGNSPRNLATPDFPLRQTWCLRRRRRLGTSRALALRPARTRGCRLAAAVRSTPRHRAAGSGAQRYVDASSCRVIRGAGSSTGGEGHARCRLDHPLLASEAIGHERAPLPGVRSRTPPAGIPAPEQYDLVLIELIKAQWLRTRECSDQTGSAADRRGACAPSRAGDSQE